MRNVNIYIYIYIYRYVVGEEHEITDVAFDKYFSLGLPS